LIVLAHDAQLNVKLWKLLAECVLKTLGRDAGVTESGIFLETGIPPGGRHIAARRHA